MADNSQLQAYLNKIGGENREIKRMLLEVTTEYRAFRKACEDAPKSITHELDSIPGRRIYYNLVDSIRFTAQNAGQRANPLTFLVSQDGPFIQTHYPLVTWKASEPNNATLFGVWRPPYSWPLADQVVDGNRIDLSWEFVDGGSQRNFQNEALPPMFSRTDNLIPLPVPTLYAPNASLQFFPTFESIVFDAAAQVPTTAGILTVALPGYRIANQ